MRLFCLLFTLGWASVFAQDEQVKEFTLDLVIHPVVKGLKPPPWYPELVSFDPAVSAATEEVQKHVSQGMALIHAGWDFEAYRHFVEAVKLDSDCLMAYWGIALSLANPNSEVVEHRLAAVNRMLELVGEGKGTASERGQAEALAFVFSDQPERAPEVFEAVSEDYPNNLQLKLMAAFLKRDGYDDLLGAGPGQREALEEVEEILKKNTESQMALSFWVALQAEHPDATGTLRERVLPRVRRLAGLAPEFPPYCELLGHFEKRAGNLLLAKKEFEKAIALYEKYLSENKLTYCDCPNLVRAQLSLASVLKRLGDFEGALVLAEKLSKLPVKMERLYSPGTTLVLWEGKTLGARICLARGQKGDFKRGLESLPPMEEGKKLAMETPSVMAWEAWRHALAARNAIETQVFDSGARYLDALAASDGLLEQVASVVSHGSSRQSWERTRNALKVEWMLAKAAYIEGQSSSKGASLADFWYQSAIDEREPPKGIFPPLSLALPPVEKALHVAQRGDHEEAVANFRIAMGDYANDISVLKAYENFLRKKGESKTADAIVKHIGIVLGGN
ncbi:MAG: tetratricopeptide repeat protein [Roseibacillus sp.]